MTITRTQQGTTSEVVFWLPAGQDTPRGRKVQLLGEGGVECYGIYFGEKFWTHWQEIPTRPKDWKAEGKHSTIPDTGPDKGGPA